MLYTDIDACLQRSFLASVRKTVTDFLEDAHYAFVEEGKSFITDRFVQRVVEDLHEKRSFQKWAQVEFEVPDEMMKDLLLKIERSMRVKKCTSKQKTFFMNLVKDLGLDEDISDDYLYMKRRLTEMHEMKKEKRNEEMNVKRATIKQIETIKNLWKNTFGEELEIDENISQREVQDLFNKVYMNRI
ncbi:hypothetical protein BK704_16290 [[Bacillus thuringiensis] serovar konkukian]|nr:hypothetical protein [Bacillus thuringiensis]MED1305626.1 hypothetical protein [Bacillus pacificus]OUB06119.1 hypothetical protein BK704_16290 [[Bacillus thuringiensis] serovar konkukian]